VLRSAVPRVGVGPGRGFHSFTLEPNLSNSRTHLWVTWWTEGLKLSWNRNECKPLGPGNRLRPEQSDTGRTTPRGRETGSFWTPVNNHTRAAVSISAEDRLYLRTTDSAVPAPRPKVEAGAGGRMSPRASGWV